MPDDDAELHNELIGRERIADLPISKLLMSRVDDAVEASGGTLDIDAVTAATIAAIVSIEELIRKG
jgi:hypothetical protein